MPRINGKTSMMNHSDTKNSRDIKNLNMNINNLLLVTCHKMILYFTYITAYISKKNMIIVER